MNNRMTSKTPRHKGFDNLKRAFEPSFLYGQKAKKDNGFTLIEVILAITLLFMVVAAVFYFYSNLMDNQGKIKEKYTLLRVAREFVDSFVFTQDRGLALQKRGRREIEGYLLEWRIAAAEAPREVVYSSGIAPTAQLNRVYVRFIKKDTGNQVLDLHFFVNAVYPPGNRPR